MTLPAAQDMVSALLSPELLERARNLSLVARRLAEGSLHGMHRSPFYGFSVEFAEHREYSPGDELKHLDWKVLGRSERYVVKQYEQETNLRGILVLDRSGSMAYGRRDILGREQGNGSKFEYGRILVAALSHVLLSQGDSVGLLLASDKVTRQVPPSSARGRLLSVCAELAAAEPADGTDLAGALERLAIQLSRRSLIVLVSDLFEDPDRLIAVLGQLHHRGHEVLVFQVLDPTEHRFDLGVTSRGITAIRDMETGAEFDAEPHLIQELVRGEIRRFLEHLDDGARRHGIHLVRCLTDRPVPEALSEYLHARARAISRIGTKG